MSIGLLGQKIGMTSVYDANGRMRPVTVIAAGDNVLVGRLPAENDGYSALKVGFDVQKESRVNKAELGEFTKAGVEPKKFVREFRLKADAAGSEINLNVTQFQPGDFVDVIGRSKGKGFQGVMKKHNFHGQGAAHGSKTHRRNGAIGNRSGSASKKTKATVNLPGGKPWRQQGTGRARAGYKSSPVWRGGGVVFGPHPRDYSKKTSKTLRRLAFQKALSERIAAGDVLK